MPLFSKLTLDPDTVALIIEDGNKALRTVDEISEVVDDPKLESARKKLQSAVSLDSHEADPENAKEADEKILETLKILAHVREEHRTEIRQIELDRVVSFFDEHIREYARPTEATAFENLVRTAQRTINQKDRNFEHYLEELKGRNFEILWRQDWFVVERFKWMGNSPHLFADKHRFEELSKIGIELLRSDDIDRLREVVAQLYQIVIRSGAENDMFDAANIIRG